MPAGLQPQRVGFGGEKCCFASGARGVKRVPGEVGAEGLQRGCNGTAAGQQGDAVEASQHGRIIPIVSTACARREA
jgi:hypothetical protein